MRASELNPREPFADGSNSEVDVRSMVDTFCGARLLSVFLFSGEDFAIDGEECSSQDWIMMVVVDVVVVLLVLIWLVVLLWRVLVSVMGEEVVWILGEGVGGKRDQSESHGQRAQRCACAR